MVAAPSLYPFGLWSVSWLVVVPCARMCVVRVRGCLCGQERRAVVLGVSMKVCEGCRDPWGFRVYGAAPLVALGRGGLGSVVAVRTSVCVCRSIGGALSVCGRACSARVLVGGEWRGLSDF